MYVDDVAGREERDASACMRRHQDTGAKAEAWCLLIHADAFLSEEAPGFRLAPRDVAGNTCQAIRGGGAGA